MAEIKKTIKEISENPSIKKGALKEIFKIIADKGKTSKGIGIGDSFHPHTMSDIETIKNLQEDLIKANLRKHFGSYNTLEEVAKRSVIDVQKMFVKLKRKPLATGIGDSYSNELFGIGTDFDPSMYTMASLPVSISPYEGATLYANRGVPQVIIDKKAKGILMNGFSFEGLEADDVKKLKEHAIKTGFDSSLPLAESLIYGGAVMYPEFKDEGLSTHVYSTYNLLKANILKQGCIKRWVTADRWNTVMIPSYNITADDYLNPSSVYIPLGAVRVNTERCALIRPSKLPFWAVISQLGWATSDFTGYMKEVYDHRITMMTIPLMFQQMSLLFQLIPLDNVLMANGVTAAQEIADFNAEEMAKASVVQPKALNSVGDIKVIDRTFAGAEPLIRAMRQNICAAAMLPEDEIFESTDKGFVTDKNKSNTRKKSEGVKMLAQIIEPSLQPLVNMLVIDCFGPESPQAMNPFVRITFNPNIVLSEDEKSDKGLKTAQYIKTLVDCGYPLHIAVKSAKQYFNYEVGTEELMALESAFNEKKLQDQQMQQEKMEMMKQGVNNPVSSDRQPGGRIGEGTPPNKETKDGD